MADQAQIELFDSVEEAIAEIAAGRPVIVTDDEDRENEGDLVFAASKASVENVNLMIQHARGLICVPCAPHHLQRLGISPMVQENRESHRTDFTISVDAAEGITTGISAYDRFKTIELLADPETRPDQLVQPGHIFPLKAKSGGVLERAGHTEAAVDLASLAGQFPCGVICEILNDDGTMARTPELFEFKKRFGLKMISIASLIEYRHQRENLVELVHERPFESAHGAFTLKVFRSVLDGREHFAFVAGELGEEPTLVRVHAENVLNDLFQPADAENSDAIGTALQRINAEGCGALVYIRRPSGGLVLKKGDGNEAAHRMSLREYGIGAQILSALGLSKIRLLSQTSRNVIALDGYGLEIVETVRL
ncbi:3,4-dihydroxy-2-butanone-4-phosphate synthase [Pelagicoccus sp. SDUM812003]|uniref:3,4-dihydroxy-2-butanone-4-phosphate synthase n=1 Tax=Pelagicoccus sp. SDUM812003 TaxID=3041267 RepID=UPI00280E6165|nr:3,4-dihydroxy-2-butanone-4-phosphate synthase [Pelagicoccus sp. SDUM812003]MDQ8202765.1 3,4-dihydroxy-2-butanone-4-phosphate synthase [Pelagicoccus sp. SDUM812003]